MYIRYFLYALIFMAFSCSGKDSEAMVKKSEIAGRWYTADSAKLAKEIDGLLNKAPAGKMCGDPAVLIVPHAGYQYSGYTAAAGYRVMAAAYRDSSSLKDGPDPELIVIIGPSHYRAFRGCALLNYDFIETPLGKVKINTSVLSGLSRNFRIDNAAFSNEHSVEIQLPFLQRVFGERMSGKTEVLPVLAGEMDDAEAAGIAEDLASAAAPYRTLFVISSDFTHYGPSFDYTPFGRGDPSRIKEIDDGAISRILAKDAPGFSGYIDKTGATICGRNAIRIALSLPLTSFKSGRIHYDTSGNITGDYSNSVSYASILFCGSLSIKEKEKSAWGLSEGDKRFLLRTARDNIAAWLSKGRGLKPEVKNAPVNCLEKRGVFVTLTIRGELRGCIGYVEGIKSLYEAVLDNSYNSAFEDPRFIRLDKKELNDIGIEISVLTVPEPVKSVEEIKTGRDGLIMERGMNRGLLLPQVAAEQGWDRETFLEQTCRKAGLPADAWKDKLTRIYRFEAIVFGEED